MSTSTCAQNSKYHSLSQLKRNSQEAVFIYTQVTGTENTAAPLQYRKDDINSASSTQSMPSDGSPQSGRYTVTCAQTALKALATSRSTGDWPDVVVDVRLTNLNFSFNFGKPPLPLRQLHVVFRHDRCRSLTSQLSCLPTSLYLSKSFYESGKFRSLHHDVKTKLMTLNV